MEKLSNWKARRSGKGLTIFAKDTFGLDRKITGVVQIEEAAILLKDSTPGAIATDTAGRQFHLA